MLFLVQDSDRPMYVIAHEWSDALRKWKLLVADENNTSIEDMDEPDGIQLVASEDEVIP